MRSLKSSRSAQLAIASVLAVQVVLLATSCDPFRTSFSDEEAAQYYEAKELKPVGLPSALRVMTYNIKFGGGRVDFFFDCHDDSVLMGQEQVFRHLRGLAEKIKQVDPDLLILQEVDVKSKRSAFVDELQWLLDHTDLNFAYYGSQWRADYVPSDGIGPVDSGNAIVSKYRLTGGRRIALPLRSDQSGIERYFFLRRNLLVAELQDMPTVRLVATHTAAFSQDGTKREHIERFKQELDRSSAWVIGAGDLNTLPPGSTKSSGFDDSACEEGDFQADDYSEESTWLSELYASYHSAIPLEKYQADNAPYFSHTTDGGGFWNRKLDYIFTNLQPLENTGVTHQSEEQGGIATMPLSDHAPLSVELRLPKEGELP